MITDLLKTKMGQQPFRPFIIEFQSGHQILIDGDSEVLFPRKRPELIIAFTDSHSVHEFEAGAITRLIEKT
jgi:hypothetical protein